MTKYLLSVYQPDSEPGPEIDMDQIVRDVGAWERELRAAGVWVFSGGLHSPTTATVMQVRDGEALVTDGPYIEGKEHIGGFTIIEVSDLDTALEWARKGAAATQLPMEIRPFQDDPTAGAA